MTSKELLLMDDSLWRCYRSFTSQRSLGFICLENPSLFGDLWLLFRKSTAGSMGFALRNDSQVLPAVTNDFLFHILFSWALSNGLFLWLSCNFLSFSMGTWYGKGDKDVRNLLSRGLAHRISWTTAIHSLTVSFIFQILLTRFLSTIPSMAARLRSVEDRDWDVAAGNRL